MDPIGLAVSSRRNFPRGRDQEGAGDPGRRFLWHMCLQHQDATRGRGGTSWEKLHRDRTRCREAARAYARTFGDRTTSQLHKSDIQQQVGVGSYFVGVLRWSSPGLGLSQGGAHFTGSLEGFQVMWHTV